MSNTLVQRLKALVEFRDDDTPVTRLIVEAAMEIKRLQAHFVTANAERETMAAHCRTIEDALKVGCVEEAVAEIERIKGENKTLRDTPVGVAATQYRRMADERAHYAQECERLRASLRERVHEARKV